MVSPVLSASDDDDDDGGDEKKDNEKVYSPRCIAEKNAAVLALSEFPLTGNFFHISPTNSSSSSSSSTLGQLFPSATRELMRYIKLCSLVT